MITAVPTRIDTGDRIRVRVEIADMHEKGIALKLRFPLGLRYVPGSSFVNVGTSELDASPKNDVSNENHVYVVYYISMETLGSKKEGILELELEGMRTLADARIEVDADVNDPTIPDETEFDISRPDFTAVDWVEVSVG